MTRTVFYGFGAFVGTIRGATTCSWWPDDPQRLGWSAQAQVPIDLANNPTAVRAGRLKIDDLQVDDHRIDGGLTTIGPRFPTGAVIGEVWLAEPYYNTLGNKPPRQPPSTAGQAYDYESTSILYWDGPLAGKRFHGYHARILDTKGPLSRVEIWNPGTGRGGGSPAGAWWLDLSQVAHPIDPDATQVAAGGQSDGALFLDAQTSRGMTIYATKRPPGLGLTTRP